VIVIANKRILFLQDINKNTVIEILNITQKWHTISAYESTGEISRKEIKEDHYIKNGTERLTNDKNIIMI
jgi:hypothetical protein